MHDTRGRRRLSRIPSIEEEITVLRNLDLKGLRVRWQNEVGRPAPEHLTRYLLFRIIAYRLQADRLGDLDAETLKVLKQAEKKLEEIEQLLTGLLFIMSIWSPLADARCTSIGRHSGQ